MAKKKKPANKKGRINKKEFEKTLAKYGENPNGYEDFHALLQKVFRTSA
jgi:hypothetical protein